LRLRSSLIPALALLVCLLTTLGVLRAQKPFREYPGNEYVDFPLPSDYQQPAEWTRGRLRYRSVPVHPTMGFFEGRNSWTIDYPRSDRHFLAGVRRLTRIDTKSVEQVVELDGTDDIYNWPFVYGVEVGHWKLSDQEAAQMRDFLLRGGFFMCDDFHGTLEWATFQESMKRVFPDRQIVDLDNKDAIFHVIYDLDDRFQIPGYQYLISNLPYEFDGFEAKWRGIYDDNGRLMVAICHNMDMGDAWEHSDNPEYPEKFASLAYRIGVNYVVYHLTH
jgi:Domain of unknown function (DUF4159)